MIGRRGGVGTGGRGARRSSGIEQGEYSSALFGQFTDQVARLGPSASILDVGRPLPSNVIFWARRGHRVTAIDWLSRQAGGDVDLGLRGKTFGGVLCWTVFADVGKVEAAALMDQINRMLVPGGLVFAIFDGDGRHRPPAMRYRIVASDRLAFERDPRQLAARAVPTSEIEQLLGALRPTRMTIMRHGSREAMGQRPRQDT